MANRGAGGEEWAHLGLDSDSSGDFYVLSSSVSALRGATRSEARGAWRGNSGARHNSWRYSWDQGDPQMTFGERFARELLKLYEELQAIPPLLVFVISCFALLFVGLLLVVAR